MAPPNSSVSIVALAEQVLVQAKAIATYYQEHGIAAPTWSPTSSTPPQTAQFVAMQRALKTSSEDLQRLVDGPSSFFKSYFMLGYDLAAMQIALDFDFFTLIPSNGNISLDELADKAGLDVDRTSRVVRLLVTHRFFEESDAGLISHNSFSSALLDDELRALVHYSLDEMLKAAAESGAALRADPYESDSRHCPFNKRHSVPIFDYYSKNPIQAARFARAMAGYRKMENSIVELRDNFPWHTLQGTVVDIGGGSGHVSFTMARLFHHLKFIVQDGSSDMLAQGQKLLTDDIRERVSFVQANFFEPQPERNVAAFLLRQCTHNWADDDVVRMFKSVVPGLEGSSKETPLLINDIVLPEPGTVTRLHEREMRQADMVMLVSFGAKQRSRSEFEVLLQKADPRFEIRKALEIGALGLLEVYLKR